jgi:hypothetical protein
MANPAEQKLKARAGRHVALEILYASGEVERLSLDLVPDAAADFEHHFLGESTPLAQAILGQVAGSVIPYRRGDAREVRLLSVSAELSAAPTDLSERREEVTRKAVNDADRTSAILFASSMNSKWGDYDPSGIESWDGESPPDDGK